MILFKSLKKYFIINKDSKSDFLYSQILLSLLCLIFVFYWLNPDSREAHFARVGTIDSPVIKLTLPIFAFIFCLGLMYLTFLLSARTEGSTRHKFNVSKHTPVAFFVLLVAVPYFLAYFGNSLLSDHYYKIFRVSNIEPTFADLRTILYGISCEDVDRLGDVISCDPREETTIWNYPTILLSLRGFGLGIEHLFILALIFTATVALASFLISKDLENQGRILFSLVIFSPPVLLCFDRMNFDLLITSLVIIAIKLVTKPQLHIMALPIALCFLSLAAILKFYAFPILIIVTLYFFKRKKELLLSLVVSACTFVAIASDLTSVREYIGRDMRGSIGFSVLTSLLNGSSVASVDLYSAGFVSAVILMAALSTLCLVYTRLPSPTPQKNLTSISLSILFLLPWLTTSSYYYRTVTIVFLLPLLFTKFSRKFKKGIWVLGVCSLYLSPVSLALIQNIFLTPLVSMQIIRLLLVFDSYQGRQRKELDG